MNSSMYVMLICMVFIVIMFPVVVSAVPSGVIIKYENEVGNVFFKGKAHAAKGYICTDCHVDIFIYKKGSANITFDDHSKGEKYCFLCHNEDKAFGPKDNCTLCHDLSDR